MRGFWLFSIQHVCLAEGVVEPSAGGFGEEEVEADFWPVDCTLAGGERE